MSTWAAVRIALMVAVVASLCGTGGGGLALAASDDPLPARTIELRERVFGAANVDHATGTVRPDRVIFGWLGVSSFAAAIDGHIVLLDAYVHRGPRSRYVPLTVNDVADLAPERIYMGHGHYDHIGDIDQIAERSGALLVGTAEHCSTLRARRAAAGTSAPAPDCLALMPAAAPAGTVVTTPPLGATQVLAVRNPHSAFALPAGGARPFIPNINLATVLRGAAVDAGVPDPSTLLCGLLRGRLPAGVPIPAPVGGRYPEGGTLLYHFKVGDFSFVWNDSAAPLRERGRALTPVLKSLAPIDLQLGAVYTVNMLTNGFRDTRDYLTALRPQVFVPTHHDILGSGRSAHAPLLRELDRIGPGTRPELRFLSDPTDYARPDPLTFTVAAAEP